MSSPQSTSSSLVVFEKHLHGTCMSSPCQPYLRRERARMRGARYFTQRRRLFCSIAQTVAHLLILRLTFYIPYHSLLFSAHELSNFRHGTRARRVVRLTSLSRPHPCQLRIGSHPTVTAALVSRRGWTDFDRAITGMAEFDRVSYEEYLRRAQVFHQSLIG